MQQEAENTRFEGEPTDPDKLSDEQLFQYINEVIVRERLSTTIRRYLLQKYKINPLSYNSKVQFKSILTV